VPRQTRSHHMSCAEWLRASQLASASQGTGIGQPVSGVVGM
jgi:hypothetical protein